MNSSGQTKKIILNCTLVIWASSTHNRIFLKTDAFISIYKKIHVQVLCIIVFTTPLENAKTMEIQGLTGHALYNAWHHCVWKPLFLSVTKNGKLTFSWRLHSEDHFWKPVPCMRTLVFENLCFHPSTQKWYADI